MRFRVSILILMSSFCAWGCNSEQTSFNALTPPPDHDPLLGGNAATVTPQLYWGFEGDQAEAVKPGGLSKGRQVHVVDADWIGLPPRQGGSYDYPIEIHAESPSWWSELNDQGLKANGIVAAFIYSEGWEAYFARYVRTHIHTELYRALLSETAPEIRPELDAQLADKNIDLMLDLHSIAPMISSYETQTPGSHSANWLEYCRRERNITDFEQASYLYQNYAIQIYIKIFREYRRLLPLAAISLYGMPTGGPQINWSTPEIVQEIKRHHRESLFWLWPLVDYLTPSLVQPYRLKVSAKRLLPGEQLQKDFLLSQKPYVEELEAISSIVQKPVVPVLMPILDENAISHSGEALGKLEWNSVLQLANLAKAKALMFFAARGFREGYDDAMNTGFVNGQDYLKLFLTGANLSGAGNAKVIDSLGIQGVERSSIIEAASNF